MIDEVAETIKEKVKKCLSPITEEYGLELVDVEFKSSGKRWLLRIYIDKQGGVVLSDCENISRELSSILDVEDFISHPYVLEVSSLGLTRPLKTRQDFIRAKGKKCKVITSKKIYNKNEFKGEITDVKEDEIEIKGKIGVFNIPIYAIKKANLEFDL
jgi:ribosome maturation factor RimP